MKEMFLVLIVSGLGFYVIDLALGVWLRACETDHAKSVDSYDALGRWHL